MVKEIQWELSPQGLARPDELSLARGAPRGKDFFGRLQEALAAVDARQKDADAAVVGFATGQVQDVHTVALALKKAELSFKFMMAVRRRCLEAYQELTRMSV